MGSITTSANHPLPVKVRLARPNWILFGVAAIVLIAGPGVLAVVLTLLASR